jgi:hypothetical protein
LSAGRRGHRFSAFLFAVRGRWAAGFVSEKPSLCSDRRTLVRHAPFERAPSAAVGSVVVTVMVPRHVGLGVLSSDHTGERSVANSPEAQRP